MTQLRVLVTEAEPGAARVAVDELRDAGHEVVMCHEPGAPAFPCMALQSGRVCPLVVRPIDVTLAIRHTPSAGPARSEDGVLCALRHHVPVIVARGNLFDPFEEWETLAVERTSSAVEECEHVASAPLRRPTEVASKAAASVLRSYGRDDLSLLIAVRRQSGWLKVEIRAHEDAPRSLRSMIAVRVSAALRAFDPDAAGIDIGFVDVQA